MKIFFPLIKLKSKRRGTCTFEIASESYLTLPVLAKDTERLVCLGGWDLSGREEGRSPLCRSRRVYGFPRDATCRSWTGFPRVSDHKQAPLWRSRTGREAFATMSRKPRGTRSTSRSRVRGRTKKRTWCTKSFHAASFILERSLVIKNNVFYLKLIFDGLKIKLIQLGRLQIWNFTIFNTQSKNECLKLVNAA